MMTERCKFGLILLCLTLISVLVFSPAAVFAQSKSFGAEQGGKTHRHPGKIDKQRLLDANKIGGSRLAPIAIARVRGTVLSDVRRLEAEADQAHRRLLKSFSNLSSDSNRDLKSYREAETRVTRALEDAWKSVALTPVVPTLVSDPLKLAFFHLQVEARRALGPEATTTVPGLAGQAGCQGDLIAGKFFARWGEFVTRPDQNSPVSERELLGEFARQLACLSSRQLAKLETGLVGGFFRIAKMMSDNDLTRLVPSFARVAVPLKTMLFDLTKNRGARSTAWLWFRAMNGVLRRELAKADWGLTNVVYLWDRRRASLIGFPACRRSGPPAAGCIAMATFMNSLANPRAIADGNCALAAMLTHGFTPLFGKDLYACPIMSCRADPTAGLDLAAVRKAHGQLQTRWPEFEPQTLLPDKVAQSFCRNMTSSPDQGDLPYGEACVNSLFERKGNPWDTYAACVVEGITTEPTVLAGFAGAPMGPECKLYSGGDDLPQHIALDDPSGAAAAAGKGMTDLPDDMPDFIDGLKQLISDIVDFFSGSGGGSVTDLLSDDAVLDHKIGDPSENKKITDEAKRLWSNGEVFNQDDVLRFRKAAANAFRDGFITYGEWSFAVRVAEELKSLIKEKGGAMHCSSPETCSNVCTGIGAQLAAIEACTGDLLDTLLEATGRKRPEPKPDDPMPPIDIVANYHPDHAPVPDSDIPACIIGDSPTHQRPSTACGLVLCGNGVALPTTGQNCTCGTTLPEFTPTSRLCLSIDCAPHQVLGDDCQCHSFDEDGSVPDWPWPVRP